MHFIIPEVVDANQTESEEAAENAGHTEEPIDIPETWICPQCGEPATGNFCSNCGSPKEADNNVEPDTQPEETKEGIGDQINNIVDSVIDAVSGDDKVTLENFNKIDSSMTYEDVCELFGKEGKLLSEVDPGIPGYETQMYMWYDNTGIWNCNVMFQGGYETTKSHIGLK